MYILSPNIIKIYIIIKDTHNVTSNLFCISFTSFLISNNINAEKTHTIGISTSSIVITNGIVINAILSPLNSPAPEPGGGMFHGVSYTNKTAFSSLKSCILTDIA